jgi:hypothetical protein
MSCDRALRGTLLRNGKHSLNEGEMIGELSGGKAKEGANGGEPSVASPDAVLALGLEMFEESADEGRIEIGDQQITRGLS